MKNFEVIVKKVKTPCYCCDSIDTKNKSTCKICKGKGQYIETQYYHIYTTKDGKRYCFDGETLK